MLNWATIRFPLFLLGSLVVLLGLATSPVRENDIFWQLQSGKYLWESGAFLYTDTFTLAASAPRWEHCWLNDLAFWAAYLLGGYAGISLLKGLLVALTGAIVLSAARRRQAGISVLLLLSLPFFLLCHTFWQERPQLWSFLCFAILLWLLNDDREHGGWRLWLVVPLVAVWANLHAGAIIALPVLAAFLVGGWAEERQLRGTRAGRRLGVVTVLSVVALLATPYGLQPFQALLPAARLELTNSALAFFNVDWQPMSYALNPWFYYSLPVAVLLLATSWRRPAWIDVLLLLGTAVMAFRLARHAPFFFISAAVVLPRYAETLLGFIPAAGWLRWARGGVMLTGLTLSLLLAGQLGTARGFFQPGLVPERYPERAVAFIRQQGLPRNLYNTYTLGGFVAWQLYPDYLAFFDSRQNSPEMFVNGLMVSSGNYKWEAILDRYQVATVLTEICNVVQGYRYPLIERLQGSKEWVAVFADDTSLVYVRRKAVPEAWINAHALTQTAIDAAILRAADMCIRENPRGSDAYWVRGEILLKQGALDVAYVAIDRYLRTAQYPHPEAVRAQQHLRQWFDRRGGEGR